MPKGYPRDVPPEDAAAWVPAWVATALGGLAALAGALVTVGWAAGLVALKSVRAGWVAVQPLTALGLMLAGGALAAATTGRRRTALALAAAVGLLGASALVQYWGDVALPGLDRVLFASQVTAQALAVPGLMEEMAAVAFVLFAAALGLACRPGGDVRAEHAAVGLASAGLLVAGVGVVGYLLAAPPEGRDFHGAMALQSGVAFVALFLGLLAAAGRRTWLASALSRRAGGRMARRLVPVVLLFPLAVGILAGRLDAAYDSRPAYSLAVALVVVMAGQVLATLWVAHVLDAADRRADEADRRAQRRFQAIYEQAAVGIELLSLDGRLLLGNGTLSRLLGYTAAELRRLNFADITHPADLPAERTLLAELLAGRRDSYAIEKRYLRKDGTPVWVRVTSSLERAADGAPRRRISVSENITAQRQLLEELKQAKDEAEAATARVAETALRFETLADNIPQFAWMARPDGWIFWYNRRWYEYTGTTFADMQGWGWSAVHHPDHLERVTAHFRRSLDAAEPWEDTFPLRGRDGAYRWFLSRAHPVLGDDGQVVMWFGTNTDITDQREQEAALKRAKDAAERANRDKSRFLAAASHDLRQPVQALTLFNSALEGRLGDHPAARLVSDMRSSLDALSMLLEGLLDVSRLDAGVIVPDTRTVSLGALVARIGAEYAPRAHAKGLDLRVVPTRRLVTSDPVLLERILRNLVENAVTYTETGAILIGCRRQAGGVLLQVLDTGIGIAPEQHEAVFEEFFQVGNSERDRAKGLGLGLSIIRRLCRLLDHPLTLSSTPGRGTCFSVGLPAAARPAEPATQIAAHPPGTHPPGDLVLVIDDEPAIRLGLSVLLDSWGFEVTAAADAEEAVARVAPPRPCPSLILADYRLRAGRIGTEAAYQVRAACGRDIPTVILTGDTSPDRLAEIAATGFGVVHKPVPPDVLRRLVLDALTGDLAGDLAGNAPQFCLSSGGAEA